MKWLLTYLFLLLLLNVFAFDERVSSDTEQAKNSFITGYTLGQSRAAQLGSLYRLRDGHTMNVVRGNIGESVAERAFFGGEEMAHSKKGNWVSVSPRYGRQGIDHIFLRVNKDGIPNRNGIMLGETKYGSAQLDNTKKDGKQMGWKWRQKRLVAISKRYARFSESKGNLIRSKDIPIGAKSLQVYVSKTECVTIWEKNGRWYTDAPDDITDARLKAQSKTYARFFEAAGNGVIKTRNFLFRVKESNGDYLVEINKLDSDANPISTRTIRIDKELLAWGRTDLKSLKEWIKHKHPDWSDKAVAKEAADIQKVISNKDLIEPSKAKENALKEMKRSSLKGARTAALISLASRVALAVRQHGLDFVEYDWRGIVTDPLKGAVTTGGASWIAQRTAFSLAAKGVKEVVAKRIGGGIAAAILGTSSLLDGMSKGQDFQTAMFDMGVNTVSMVVGNYAGASVMASTASGAGGSGSLAMDALVGTTVVSMAVAAAISSVAYLWREHRLERKRTYGEIRTLQKRLDYIETNHERLDRSIDVMVGR